VAGEGVAARPRTWFRRLSRAATKAIVALALLLVAFRLVLPFALVTSIDLGFGAVGLSASYERFELSLLSGVVRLDELEIRPAGGDEVLLRAAHVGIEVYPTALFTGRVSARRVEVDGAEALLDRGADSVLEIVRIVKGARAGASERLREPGDDQQASTPIFPLLQRFRLEALRVQGVKLRYRDRSVDPPVDVTARLDIRLSEADLLAPAGARPTRVEIVLRAAPVLTALSLDGEVRFRGEDANASLDIALDRLSLGPLQGLLAPLGIRPAAEDISLALSARARPHPGRGGAGAGPGWDLAVERVRLKADGVVVGAVDRADVEVSSIAHDLIEVGRVAIEGVRARAERRADGALRIAGVDLVPAAATAAEEGAARDASPPSADAPPPKLAPPSPLRMVISELSLSRVRAAFLDRAVEPEVSLSVMLDEGRVRGIVHDPVTLAPPATVALSLSAPGLAERVSVSGTALLAGRRKEVDLSVAADGIAPLLAAPYLASAGLHSDLTNGRLRLRARATLSDAREGGLALTARVDEIAFSEGTRELAAIDRVEAAGRVDPAARVLDVTDLEVQGPRGDAARDASGAVSFLGLRTVTPPSRTAHVARDAIGDGAENSLRAQAGPGATGRVRSPWRITVGRAALRDGRSRFRDEAVRPTSTAAIESLALDVTGFALAHDASERAPAHVRLAFGAPGIADRFELSGTVRTSVETPTASLRLAASGIDASAAEGWLAAAGLGRELRSAALDIAVSASARIAPDGSLAAEATIERVKLEDGGRDLLLVEGLAAAGLRVASAGERIQLDSLTLGRVWVAASTDREGRPGALGLRLLARERRESSGTAEAAPVRAPDPTRGAAPRPPALSLGRLDVREVAIDLEDGRREAPLYVPIRFGAQAGPFVFDPASAAPPADAPFSALLSLPGSLESLALTGEVALSSTEVRGRADLRGAGISGESLAPILREAGLASALKSGRLKASASARVRFGGDALEAAAALENIALIDTATGVEWVGLDALRIEDVKRQGTGLTVGEIALLGPRALVRFDADGAAVVLGMRLTPASAERDKTQGTSTIASTSTSTATGDASALRTVEVRRIRAEGVAARLEDHARPGGAPLLVTASASLEQLVMGRQAPGARLEIALSIPGALDRLGLEGRLTADPEAPALEAVLAAEGLRAGPLAPYLPPGIAVRMRNGRLVAAIRASAAPNREGGRRAEAAVTAIRLTDAGDPEPLLSIDAVRASAHRIDPAGGRIAFEEIAVRGVEARIERALEGETRLLGLAIGGAPPTGTARPAPAALSKAAPSGAAPASPAETAPMPSTRLPLVTCERLIVDLRRIVVTHPGEVGAVPLVVKGLELRNSNLLQVLGPDPTSLPYLGLDLSGEISPLVKLVTATARISPFALDPEGSVRASVSGVRGLGITEVLPSLGARIEGKALKDGRGHIQIVVRPQAKRRDPMDWSFLSKGFGLEATVRRTWFRDGDGPILLGIQDFRIDAARFEPATGALRIREIEIAKPSARIWRDWQATYVGGIGFKPDRPQAATGTAAPKPAAPAAPGASPPSASDPAPGPEQVLERFVLSDCDIVYEDRAADPPMTIPIAGADVEAGPFGARLAGELQPTRFDATLRAGQVKLPKRTAQSFVPGLGAITDVIGTVAEATGAMDAKKVETQMRALFQDFSAKGELLLGARTSGTVHATLGGLELGALAGAARRSRVNLVDGTFDLDLTLDMARSGAVDLSADARFTDLDVTEPPDGPIASTLGLPAPLNAVLFALRNEDGEILIPVRVSEERGFDGGLGGAITRAVAQVAGTALANIGFRAVDTVGDLGKGVLSFIPGVDMIPFLSEATSVTYAPVVLAFTPGEPSPSGAETAKLAAIVAAAQEDDQVVVTLEHAIGGGDYARSRVRANPSPEDRRDVLARLGNRKRDAEGRRRDLAAEARAALVVGLDDEARAAALRLQAVDQELVAIETSLDRMYELERGGAERQAGRRGRLASLGLARARLDAVRAALVLAGCPDLEGRIVFARPRIEDAPGTAGGTVTVTAARRRKK